MALSVIPRILDRIARLKWSQVRSTRKEQGKNVGETDPVRQRSKIKE